MSAYQLVQGKIHDAARFMPYAKQAAQLVEQFGGRYLVRGGTAQALEGGWDQDTKVVISQWPDRAAALRFWNSPEYRETAKLREGAGEFQVTLLDSGG